MGHVVTVRWKCIAHRASVEDVAKRKFRCRLWGTSACIQRGVVAEYCPYWSVLVSGL